MNFTSICLASRDVVDRIGAELMQILKKDFNRRMIEGTAFKGKKPFWIGRTQIEANAR